MGLSEKERVARVLDEAAVVLEKDGWCRGSYEDGRGRFCLAGAVARAAGTDPERVQKHPASRALERELYTGSIVGWNDQQRDKRKVTRLLRRTARKVRAGEIRV